MFIAKLFGIILFMCLYFHFVTEYKSMKANFCNWIHQFWCFSRTRIFKRSYSKNSVSLNFCDSVTNFQVAFWVSPHTGIQLFWKTILYALWGLLTWYGTRTMLTKQGKFVFLAYKMPCLHYIIFLFTVKKGSKFNRYHRKFFYETKVAWYRGVKSKDPLGIHLENEQGRMIRHSYNRFSLCLNSFSNCF